VSGELKSDLEGRARREAFTQLQPPGPGVCDVSPVLKTWISVNAAPELRDAMKAGIDGRNEYGLTKYPHLLRTGDGRPTAIEVWHELLDGLQYGMKAAMEGERIDTPLIREAHRLLGVMLDGVARAPARTGPDCPECGGRGAVCDPGPQPTRRRLCESCRGTGEQSGTPAAGGRCPNCGGLGWARGFSCEPCQGTGDAPADGV
jgi:hypothetical protein